MKRFLCSLILLLSSFAVAANPGCLNFPIPEAGAHTTAVCHVAYTSIYDTQWHLPRLVVYELTADESLGCLPRMPSFHMETGSASPSDYNGTGYDLGHMGPAEDFSADKTTEYESFSMVNVAPQLPGLNRQEWERLEETVRAWAWMRKDVLIYVGPILSANPKTIGKNVAVPDAFFKIILDRHSLETIALIIPQQNEAKGDLTPFITTVDHVDALTGINFSAVLPTKLVSSSTGLWPIDLPGWRQAHKANCQAAKPLAQHGQ